MTDEREDTLEEYVEEYAGGAGFENLTAAQRALCALVTEAFASMRHNLIDRVAVRIAQALGYLLLGAVLVFGGMGLLALVVGWIYAPAVGVLSYLPVLFLVLLGIGVRWSFHTPDVEFCAVSKRRRLVLGRMSSLADDESPAHLALFFGMAVSLQVALLYFTEDHAGADISGGFVECCLVVADNFCHGAFLDAFELYDLSLFEFEHTTWSATLFFVFRLVFDAILLMLAYTVYQGHKLRAIVLSFPAAPDDADDVADWIHDVSSESRLYDKFTDESIFLLIVEEFLRKRYATVRQVSQQFPRLRVTQAVRDQFRDGNGKALFAERPPEDDDTLDDDELLT